MAVNDWKWFYRETETETENIIEQFGWWGMAALSAQLILSWNKQTIKRTNNTHMRQVCAWVVALNKSRPKKGGFSLTSQLLVEIYQKLKFMNEETKRTRNV